VPGVVLPIRDDNPTSRRAVVTIALIAINLFVYFLVQPHDGPDAEQLFVYEHAVIPCEVTGGEPVLGVPVTGFGFAPTDQFDTDCAVGTNLREPRELFPDKPVYLAVVFSMFLHGSVAHVLGNMLFLWIFGNNVEDRLGHVAYLLFYLFTGVVATAVFIALNPDSTVPLVGASGAIAGVMGAYIVWFPRARVLSLLGIFPLYLPAVAVLGLWFVLQFATNPNEGVAWQAHVGGFVAGAVIAFLTRGLFRDRPEPRHWDDPDDRGWDRGGRRRNDDGWDGGFRGGYPGRL
jgi:membrane associated rhomboid family serine protease